MTTIGGLLPLSLAGGAFWGPFGFVMIFGLAASTVLTLERFRGRRSTSGN